MMIILIFTALWCQNQVYVNARITTLDPDQPLVRVLITEGSKIVFTGQSVPPKYADQPQIDLKGHVVLPGLTDAHAHVLGLGNALERLDLRGATSFNAIIEQVSSKAKAMPSGSWVLGRGWDQNLWDKKTFPVHQALSAQTPNNPVCLYRVDGHALLLNAKAMQELGIDAKTVTPEGGSILKDKGQPTGIFIDNAMNLAKIPKPSDRELKKNIQKAAKYLVSLGIVGVHDAGVTSQVLRSLEQLASEGQLPIRIYAMLDQEERTLQAELPKGPRLDLFDGHLTIRCIKVYADGALGSRGAWMKQAYSDKPHHTGLQLTSGERFDTILKMANQYGFQVATHAIGDRANRFVLDHYRAVIGPSLKQKRFRIEHAQIVAPKDIPLFADYGVIPSMQPTHCTSDMDWAGERVGPTRIKGAYAWRRFLDAGCYLPFGSDFPVEKPSPWDGLYSGITRTHQDGTPLGGFFSDQRLTRLEALKGFTVWAAKAGFLENTQGSLTPGKYADFIVIDRDYYSVAASDIPKTRVLRTVVGGKTVYQSPSQ